MRYEYIYSAVQPIIIQSNIIHVSYKKKFYTSVMREQSVGLNGSIRSQDFSGILILPVHYSQGMVPGDLTRGERSDLQMTRNNGSKTDSHRRIFRLCAQSIHDV